MAMTKEREKELIQLAEDIHQGRVFTDRHIRPGDVETMGTMIFMPLIFMEGKEIKKFQKDPPGLIYEYLNRAGPRSINGYPTFMSFRIVPKEEMSFLEGYIERFRAVAQAIKGELDPKPEEKPQVSKPKR
jgi:hypothetical protein